MCVRKHAHARGVWGYGPPGKFLQIRCSEIASQDTFGPNRHYSYCIIVICASSHAEYDSSSYRRPHAMQWPLLKNPNF